VQSVFGQAGAAQIEQRRAVQLQDWTVSRIVGREQSRPDA
jgi:hypothetical protein